MPSTQHQPPDAIRTAVLATIEAHDKDFVPVATRLYSQARDERELSAHEIAIIEMVIYGNVTYYNPAQLRRAMAAALAAGASEPQLVKVLELTAVVGLHGLAAGAPLLTETLRTRGETPQEEVIPADVQANIDEVMVNEWAKGAEQVISIARLDPQFADIMVDWTRVWNTELLELKLKELIYLAFDATTTHMFLSGLSAHIRRALEAGATYREIMQVLELTVVPSMDLLADGLNLLESVVAEDQELRGRR